MSTPVGTRRTRWRDPTRSKPLHVRYVGDEGESVVIIPTLEIGSSLTPRDLVRDIERYAGTTNTPGLYWSSTQQSFLPYESWLEAKWLQLLDQDTLVEYLMTQPLSIQGLDWGGLLEHTPDIFARLEDGSGVLIDVTAPPRRHDPKVIRRANLAAATCQALGWTYYLVTEPPIRRLSTVSWLAGYRRLAGGHQLIGPLLEAAADPIALGELWSRVPPPLLSKTVTFHLMWAGRLGCDLNEVLTERTIVWRP